MSDTPEKIWAYHNGNSQTYLTAQNKFHNIEYVRADIHATLEAEVSRLTTMVDEAPTSQECIAAEMRRLRAVRKLGIRAMAKEVGISPATLSRVENGAEPDMKTSRSILRYAGACSCCGAAFAEKAGA